MVKADSSYIEAYEHDPATDSLKIQFKSGKTFEYSGVTADHMRSLIDAAVSLGSFGKAFHQVIKGKFESWPMEGK